MAEDRGRVEERGGDAAGNDVPKLGAELSAEFIGTFILIFIGNGAVAVSVALGQYDLLGVALVWAIALALAIYGTGAVSGAHFNPAVSITFAIFTDFPWRKVGPYIITQVVAAFVASAAIYLSFGGIISAFEQAEGLTRGEDGSQLSAMIFATYGPNPAIIGTGPAALAQVSLPTWFITEVLMTAVLLFVIFYLVDEANADRPLGNFAPVMIGLLVAALICYGAPISMTALNPARDFGPRLFALLAGWGPIAIPGPRSGFWIPIVAPILGAMVGGLLYHSFYKRTFPKPAPPGERPPEAEAQ